MEVSRPALGPTHPPVMDTGSFWGWKRLKRRVDVSGNVHTGFQRLLRCARVRQECPELQWRTFQICFTAKTSWKFTLILCSDKLREIQFFTLLIVIINFLTYRTTAHTAIVTVFRFTDSSTGAYVYFPALCCVCWHSLAVIRTVVWLVLNARSFRFRCEELRWKHEI